jgi:hypothetical protein
MRQLQSCLILAVVVLAVCTKSGRALSLECPTTCANGGSPNPSADKLTCCSCPALYAQPNCSFLVTAMVPVRVVGANQSTAAQRVLYSSQLFADNVRNKSAGFAAFTPDSFTFDGRDVYTEGAVLADIPMTFLVVGSAAWRFTAEVAMAGAYRTEARIRNAWIVGEKRDSAGGPFSAAPVRLFTLHYSGYAFPVEWNAIMYVGAGVIVLLLFPIVEGLLRKCFGGVDETSNVEQDVFEGKITDEFDVEHDVSQRRNGPPGAKKHTIDDDVVELMLSVGAGASKSSRHNSESPASRSVSPGKDLAPRYNKVGATNPPGKLSGPGSRSVSPGKGAAPKASAATLDVTYEDAMDWSVDNLGHENVYGNPLDGGYKLQRSASGVSPFSPADGENDLTAGHGAKGRWAANA